MSEPRSPTTVGSTPWVVTLAALTAMTALSIDLGMPAQPTLARTFDVDNETAGLTLSLFLIGFAIAQLLVGYLSDAWGRRRVLLAGLVVFAIAGVACALSPTIEVLLVCRVVQGIGASTAPVVARAMVRDTQPAAQAARLLSTMLASLAVAPMIAPSIGSVLLTVLGWRAIFAGLAVAGVVLLVISHLTLVETLPPERRLVASPLGLFRGFRTFLTTPGTRLPMLIGCTSFAGQFAYIADSPYVLMEGYGVSRTVYGVLFGATALALMIGSITGGRMLRAGRPPGAMIVIGTSIIVLGGISAVIGTRIEGLGIAGFLPPMIVYFFGVGIASPSATALALAPVPHIAGTASAAIGFLTMIVGALAGYETTKLGGGDPRTFAMVAGVMAVTAAVLAGITVTLKRRHRARAEPG